MVYRYLHFIMAAVVLNLFLNVLVLRFNISESYCGKDFCQGVSVCAFKFGKDKA